MRFYISTTYDNGSGWRTNAKEEFLKELSLLIDDCITNGGTYFEVTVDTDASCYESEGKNETLD